MYSTIIRPAASLIARGMAHVVLALGLMTLHAMIPLIVKYLIQVDPFGNYLGDEGIFSLSAADSGAGLSNTHALCMVLAFAVFIPEGEQIHRVGGRAGCRVN